MARGVMDGEGMSCPVNTGLNERVFPTALQGLVTARRIADADGSIRVLLPRNRLLE